MQCMALPRLLSASHQYQTSQMYDKWAMIANKCNEGALVAVNVLCFHLKAQQAALQQSMIFHVAYIFALLFLQGK